MRSGGLSGVAGLGFAVALLALPPAARAAGLDAKKVDALVGPTLKRWSVPGLAVAVVRDGEVVYLKGHGVKDVEKKGPVTPDTVFPIASCTKGFTTTAMAMLVGEGKMGWDDRVRKHVPFFHLSDPLADREVTLRDLVTHRTGLAGHHLLWYRSPWSQEEIVRRAGKLPLSRPFRTAFQYQSTMFNAAGLAVASASGMSWDEFVRKRLFTPLGMRSACCTSTAARKAPDHAGGHRLLRRGEVEPMPGYPMPTPDAAGSIHASARDLAKWVQFHLDGGTAGKNRLVSASALGETHSPQFVMRMTPTERELFPDTVQMSYGMAWVVHDYRGLKVVEHGGAVDGFRAHFTLVPEKRLGIVLLCNLHQTHMNLALSNGLVDLALGLPPRDWTALHRAALGKVRARDEAREKARLAGRHHGTTPSRELAAYAGRYEHPAYGSVRVALERGGLVWVWHDFRPRLEHFHYDTFRLVEEPVGPAEVVFALDERGDVARFKVTGTMNVTFEKVRARR
jgi:CubicO group peptidase (beta-lactamase class C family)